MGFKKKPHISWLKRTASPALSLDHSTAGPARCSNVRAWVPPTSANLTSANLHQPPRLDHSQLGDVGFEWPHRRCQSFSDLSSRAADSGQESGVEVRIEEVLDQAGEQCRDFGVAADAPGVPLDALPEVHVDIISDRAFFVFTPIVSLFLPIGIVLVGRSSGMDPRAAGRAAML